MVLKNVCLENGSGQSLEICPSCFGSGVYVKATRVVAINGLEPRTESIFCKKSDERRLKKEGYRFESGNCKHCGGAGMCKSSGDNTW